MVMDYEPSPELLRYFGGDDPNEREMVRAWIVANLSEISDRSVEARPEGSSLGMAFPLSVQGAIWFILGLTVGALAWK
jgi:hypothetical protein